MAYAIAVLLIGFLILIHELGHFLAARALRIPVERFSIGFGPKLLAFRRGGIEYRVSAIPLGGYVMPKLKDENEYLQLSLRRRWLFSLGGPAANLLLALPTLAIINALNGMTSFYDLALAPFPAAFDMLRQICVALMTIFSQPEHLSSVVGIVAAGGKFIGLGLARALQFTAIMTLNLAVFNLLPLPPLDGGKIILDLLHRLQPKLAKAYLPVTAVGWVLMIGLMIYATILDFGRMAA